MSGSGLACVLGIVALSGAWSTAHAQSGDRPRIGYAAPPAAPAQPANVPRTAAPPPVYYVVPEGYYLAGAPYVVLSDGSVLVSFGGGYERVLRACLPVQPAVPVDPWARDALGRIPEPPGIAALRAGSRGHMGGPMPSPVAVACYRTDAQGRVMVGTP